MWAICNSLTRRYLPSNSQNEQVSAKRFDGCTGRHGSSIFDPWPHLIYRHDRVVERYEIKITVERLRSIVTSMSVYGSVCLSVCLPVYLRNHTPPRAIFIKFSALVACVRGSVLLRHVYDRPHRLSPGRGFLPHWKCIIGRERGMGVHIAGEALACYLRLPCFFVGLGPKFLDSGSQPSLNGSPRNLHISLVWVKP